MAARTQTPGATAPPRPVTPLGILAARLAQLGERLDALDGVDDALKAELRGVAALAGGLDPYLERCTTPQSPALARLAQRTRAEDWGAHPGAAPGPLEQEMLSGHVEGQLLKLLVHATRARRVLDIGLFTGYSALAMAEAMDEGGEVVACEVDPHAAQLAERSLRESPGGERVTVRVAPARDTLRALAQTGEPFDLVFIDANKGGYAEYLAAVLDADLLAPRGLICVDNTLMQGEPYLADARATPNGTAIAAFNAAVVAEPRVEQVLIPLRDGLTLIRRVR